MIERGRIAALAAAALLIALCCALPAHADGYSPPVLSQVAVGFSGQYKLAHWTPVELTFVGGSEQMVGQAHLILPDGDGTPCVITSRPVSLLPGRRTTVLMYAKFASAYSDMNVVFRVNNQSVVEETIQAHANGPLSLPPAADASQSLVVTLGSSIGTEEAARLHKVAGGDDVAVAHLHDTDELPTEWYGYDGVDWLIISTSQLESLSKMLDTGAGRAALADWVEQGGKLALIVGSRAPEVFAPDAPLSSFAPGRFIETTTLHRTSGLEGFVGGSKKVPHAANLQLSVPRFENVSGRIEVADGNLPLIVRSPRRFGQILFVAVDLDRQPFIDWEGRGSLVARLLGLAEPGTTNASPDSPNYAYNRYGWDLAANMRRGLDEFTGVTPISFAVVALLILGYIVLIGPGDYFLVRRGLKRMELTWITFPLWVVLVSVGAYALAVYTKGHELRLNQVDLVDVDTEHGAARATTWLNVFTPQSQSFDLTVEPREPSGASIGDSHRLMAWLGSGDPNMNARTGGLFSGRYSFSPQLDELAHVPIQVWSTKSFFNRSSYQQQEMVFGDITINLDGVPTGTLRNDLKIPLDRCLLLSGRWAYVLGQLEPGQTVKLKSDELRDLEHVLRRPNANSDPDNTPNYYGGGNDVLYTLDQMMFFKASGGRTPESVTNGNQAFLDLSDLLALDRAILVGRAEPAASQLMRDGKPLFGKDDRHWTVYRFVFPVNKVKGKTDRD